MSDEKSVLSPFAPPPSTGADYDAICAAVMETARGRWFLAEYARRNRHADTEAIIGAIERIEARLVNGQDVAPSDRVRFDLKDMAEAIARTRAQIAAIKPDGAGNGALLETSVELDSIVQTTERATSDILAAAEQIQEIAWTAREQGVEGKVCDALDQRATDIYTACAFQDLTGQRTRKVIEVLCFLEERIAAMIEIWGQSAAADADAGHRMPHIGIGQAGDRLDQAEVDRMMPAPSPMEYVDPPARQNADSPAHADPDADRIASPPAAVSPPSAIAAPEAGQGSADPAALLDRILSLVRVSMADSDEHAAPAPPERRQESHTALVVPPLVVEPVVPAARAEDETGGIAQIAAAPAQPAKPATAAPLDDSDEDILMPLPGPISVAEAVEQMLSKGPPRPSPLGKSTHGLAPAPPAMPQESERIVAQPVAIEPMPMLPIAAEPMPESATEPAAEQSGAPAEVRRTVVLDAPELTAEAAPEPVRAPAPPSLEEPPEPLSPPAEEAVAEPIVAMPAPAAEPPAPPPQAAPVRPAAPKPAPPAPLPALAALSEEEKIALFS